MCRYIIIFLLFAISNSAFSKEEDIKTKRQNIDLDQLILRIAQDRNETDEVLKSLITGSNLMLIPEKESCPDQNKINTWKEQAINTINESNKKLREKEDQLENCKANANELRVKEQLQESTLEKLKVENVQNNITTMALKYALNNCNLSKELLRGNMQDDTERLRNVQSDLFSVRKELDNKQINLNEIKNQLDSAQNEIKQLEHLNKRLILFKKYPTLCFPDDKDTETRTISVPGHNIFPIRCNSEGWIVIQRRNRGNLEFSQKWRSYKWGFGNLLKEEFFLGLKYINILTSGQPHELLISLTDFDDKAVYALYNHFEIGDASEKYKLKLLGSYSGDAGDGLRDSEGFEFNDPCSWFDLTPSGWWNSKFDETNLNKSKNRIQWKKKHYKRVEMMIRPVMANKKDL